MSTDFPFVAGDNVRCPWWGEGEYVTITAVGVKYFLSTCDWNDDESLRHQSDGPWFRYGTGGSSMSADSPFVAGDKVRPVTLSADDALMVRKMLWVRVVNAIPLRSSLDLYSYAELARRSGLSESLVAWAVA